jgi:hypothetical protein
MGLLEGIRLPPTNWAATGLRQARERQGGTLGSGVSAEPRGPAWCRQWGGRGGRRRTSENDNRFAKLLILSVSYKSIK